MQSSAINDTADPVYNRSSKLNTTNIDIMFFHLNWMCPVSCVILVYGLIGNLLVIYVFQHRSFGYMKLPIYIVILCLLQMWDMLLETVKIFSCLIDGAIDSEGKNDPSLYTVCVYTAWFGNLVDYALNSILIFIVHNRFKALGARDVTTSRLKAKRIPIIVTMTIIVLSIIPSSLYHSLKMVDLKKLEKFRCSSLYIFPVNNQSTTDRLIYFFPLICQVMVAALLVAVFIRYVASNRMMGRSSKYSLAFSRDTLSALKGQPYSDVHITFSGTVNRPGVSHMELKEKDKTMTICVSILAFGYMLISFFRHVIHLLHPNNDTLVIAVICMNLLLMAYTGSTFLIFLIGDEDFRDVVAGYYNERFLEKGFYKDMDLASRMDLFRYSGQSKDTDVPTEDSATSKFFLEDFTVSRDELRLNHISPRAQVCATDRKNPNRKPLRTRRKQKSQ